MRVEFSSVFLSTPVILASRGCRTLVCTYFLVAQLVAKSASKAAPKKVLIFVFFRLSIGPSLRALRAIEFLRASAFRHSISAAKYQSPYPKQKTAVSRGDAKRGSGVFSGGL